MPSPNIWIAASDNDVPAVARFLDEDATSVNARDENGYTPIHAATSYNHISLLKSLIQTYRGDPNITDHDGDTPLFFVETVETACCLVGELNADPKHRNSAGLTAAEAIEEDGQFPLVAAYLRRCEAWPFAATADGKGPSTTPKPPACVEVNLSTVEDAPEMAAPVDGELRRRIQQLADRSDFESEEAQRELRALVTGAVREHVVDPEIAGRNVRARQEG